MKFSHVIKRKTGNEDSSRVQKLRRIAVISLSYELAEVRS
jgi:hypothetical protein